MDYFKCERCNTRTHFEENFFTVADSTEKLRHLVPDGDGSMVTFYHQPYGRDYTTPAECVCFECGLAATTGAVLRKLQPHAGLWEKRTYYPGGQLKSQMSYKDDKRHGLAIHWHCDGKKEIESTFVNNKLHGLQTMWCNISGKKTEASWVNSKLHGPATTWHRCGTIADESYYLRGEEVSEYTYNSEVRR